MCGITGFWQPPRASQEEMTALAQTMADRLAHRGPDDAGAWADAQAGIAFGHRRLSIVDLSPAGRQPMISAGGRYVFQFNGEFYNHAELRNRIEAEGKAPPWRGHSDTETVLACIEEWGLERALRASVGMFALTLWDRATRTLTLALDRFGEKPLYYGWQNGVFLFGSELKALRAHPAFRAEIDRNALTLLLRHNCIAAPHCIYTDIRKLEPGHLLRVELGDGARTSEPQPWWRFNDAVDAGLAQPFAGSDREAIDMLEQRLSESIGAQMLADVPLGAFLSGGVDSSTVVALMQAQSSRAVKTFTVGFNEGDYDEASHARAIARHLGTQHTEVYVRPQAAREVIPLLPSIYDEPFADSSQIPTFLISQLARQHVTVALSGDAGDELFGGYNRYLMAHRVWGRVKRLPVFMRRSLAGALRALPPSAWGRLFDLAGHVLPGRLRLAAPGDKAQKLADVLALSDGHAFFAQVTSQWKDPVGVVPGASEPPTLMSDEASWPNADCLEHWMMAMDTQTYLAADILAKVDRAAMANSLETRIPMLDHRLVEMAWRLPIHLKIRYGEGKWLLRQVLYRHVPRKLVERPKMGFGIPLDSWLRGPLRTWAEDLLDEGRLRREGWFDPAPIRDLWREHLLGRHNWQHHLWAVLAFQAWLSAQEAAR